MPRPARCAVMALSCMLTVAAVATLAQAQEGGAGPCRQGVLALIVMIDGDEQDRSHYRSTAASVVKTCGRPAGTPASTPMPFDKAACAKLALAMLDSIEDSNIANPRFMQARDEFADKCMIK